MKTKLIIFLLSFVSLSAYSKTTGSYFYALKTRVVNSTYCVVMAIKRNPGDPEGMQVTGSAVLLTDFSVCSNEQKSLFAPFQEDVLREIFIDSDDQKYIGETPVGEFIAKKTKVRNVFFVEGSKILSELKKAN